MPNRKQFISQVRKNVADIKKSLKKIEREEARKISDEYKFQMNRDLTIEDYFSYIKPVLEKYNEKFLCNPIRTLGDLETRIEDSIGFDKRIYSIVYEHYSELRELTKDSSQ